MHCILAGDVLNQASPEQRQRWLRSLISGEVISAFATSEPGPLVTFGAHAVQTEAVTYRGWIMNGRQSWVTNAPVGDIAAMVARIGQSLSKFSVPTSRAGVTS